MNLLSISFGVVFKEHVAGAYRDVAVLFSVHVAINLQNYLAFDLKDRVAQSTIVVTGEQGYVAD
jgi:hypothetical protein